MFTPIENRHGDMFAFELVGDDMSVCVWIETWIDWRLLMLRRFD